MQQRLLAWQAGAGRVAHHPRRSRRASTAHQVLVGVQRQACEGAAARQLRRQAGQLVAAKVQISQACTAQEPRQTGG